MEERWWRTRAICKHLNDTIDEKSRQCSKNPDLCVFEGRICDGIANCPDAEDESIEECGNGFHPLATLVCDKADILNVNITTKAVPCNGIVECKDGSDELNCSSSLSDEYMTYAFIAISVLITIFSFIYWKHTVRQFKPINQDQTLTKEDFELLHGTMTLQTRVLQMQSYPDAETVNTSIISLELKHHNKSFSETALCIKVSQL